MLEIKLWTSVFSNLDLQYFWIKKPKTLFHTYSLGFFFTPDFTDFRKLKCIFENVNA